MSKSNGEYFWADEKRARSVASAIHVAGGADMTAGRCPTCLGPAHPRLFIRQAVHVPPPRRHWWPSLVVGGVVLGIAVAEGLVPALIGAVR